jgi:hypothetical protein
MTIIKYCFKIVKLTDVTLEVFTAMAMKNGVFWDVTPPSSG